MSTMETAIAKAMQNSLLTTAQATIATEAEITELVRVYKQLKGKYTNAGVKLSYTAMLIKAVAMALENHKALRSTMADENHIKISSRIHIGYSGRSDCACDPRCKYEGSAHNLPGIIRPYPAG